jgi:DNA topoisomerase I
MEGKTLLIVESGAKSKTIEKLLGPDFRVMASFGHIRSLDDEGLGIDVSNNFAPTYKIMDDKKNRETISRLREAISRAGRVLIASDEDREGEAIAWHIAQVFKIPVGEKNRVTFHEITKSALEKAIRNPRAIDMNMVNSQQARQVLDKLVGFDLSPVLWKYVAPKLSAGRVQSVVLKMVIEKENEIEAFKDRHHFRTTGLFQKNIKAGLNVTFDRVEQARGFLEAVKAGVSKSGGGKVRFVVAAIDKIRVSKSPPPPFITSSIQQEAGCRFGVSSKKIMAVLQKLYQNGKITYHRTDSTTLSVQALNEIKEYVLDSFGSDFYEQRQFRSSAKNAQEAHEAIRPTYIRVSSLEGEKDGDSSEYDKLEKRVYELIWKRTVASQMSECLSDVHTMKIMVEGLGGGAGGSGLMGEIPFIFTAKAETIVFEGYKKLYDEQYKGKKEREEDEAGAATLMESNEVFESMKVGAVLKMNSITSTEVAVQPTPRYSEAHLIKNMERRGVGRPSTYASTIDTLLARNYVEVRDIEGKKVEGTVLKLDGKEASTIDEKKVELKIGEEKKKLVPTSTGRVAVEFLGKHFENILNYDFTSQMETKLDEIAQNKHVWHGVVREYYDTFHPTVCQLLDKSNAGTAKSMKADRKRLLGAGEDGRNVYVYLAKYGPVFQVGEDTDKEKRYVKLDTAKYPMDTVTLEDYKSLTADSAGYPKVLGRHRDADVVMKKGPFGIYLNYAGKNYKATNPEMSLEEFVAMIEGRRVAEGAGTGEGGEGEAPVGTVIKEFGKYMVKNGKYGPYLQYEKTIAKIPKGVVPGDMTKEMCKELIEKAKAQSKETKGKKKHFASMRSASGSDI